MSYLSAYFLVFVAGACMGSFANVLRLRMVHALLANEEPDLKKRSHCPNCKKNIRIIDLIPMINYLFLKGRCHFCGCLIPRHYLLHEIGYGLLALVAVWLFGITSLALFCYLLFFTLLILSSIDLQCQQLPDSLTLFLLIIGLLLSALGFRIDAASSILGAFSGYALLYAISTVFRLLGRGEVLGFGDLKLLAAIGAWTGWQLLPQVLLASSLFGLISGTIWLIYRGLHWRTPIPFGPSLSFGCILVIVWNYGNL